ncbi:uncharacterized protein LOC111711825 [Eurytemora carolleeae]|uniref:uncharacterized protein LOC111711825 n=1 Tax=Eurytemora carolleeae TaxID=1294199 RepID=UPI000C77DC39|nr:uncharacterized protein LOC111711825 [Eurytemora carolleeae]|eukprot:XP_023342044.1 uncharacterized protein LOC111711825 [Eurytemora affinis]
MWVSLKMTALNFVVVFSLLAFAIGGRMYKKNGHIYKATWNQEVLKQIPDASPICCAGLCNMEKEFCNSFHYNKTSKLCSLANLTKLEDVLFAEDGIDVFIDLEFLKHLVSECPANKPYSFDNRSKCCEDNLEENYTTKFPGLLTQKSKSCSGKSVVCKSGICKRSKIVESVSPFQVLDIDLQLGNITVVGVTSKSTAAECGIECDNNEDCQGWTYNAQNWACYIKQFNGVETYFSPFDTPGVAISGYKPSFTGLTLDDF